MARKTPARIAHEGSAACLRETKRAVMASPHQFAPGGKSGTMFSDLLPHTATCADDICLMRALHSDAFNHDPGEMMLMTGGSIIGRPSMGAWVTYGLGSVSKDLPGFVVLGSGTAPSAGSNNWSNGFLPSVYQGTRFRNQGDPIPYLSNPSGLNRELQRARLDAMKLMNEKRQAATGDQDVAARIASYELAFRMQISAPELLDFSKEPARMLESYGVNQEPTHPFAINCLLARRMVERGVRFVMVYHGGWDHHDKIDEGLATNCQIVDRPASAAPEGSQTTGNARFDARHLGRGVWPHTYEPDESARHAAGTRSPSKLLFQLDGWRRRQGRPGCRKDR